MSADEGHKDESTVSAIDSTETATKPTKDRKNRKEKVKPLAKVVVRRLPPTMTEEEFRKQIEPIPDHDYFYFVSADWSLGVNATCRAYINFCNPNDIFIFRDKFDGYEFVDGRGNEYPAIVEFAPFQGLQKGKSRKKDVKSNSIETEPHYIAFLETLQDDETDPKTEMKMEYSFQIKDDQKITSTPLLEYLANVRQERRDERKRKVEDRKRRRDEEKQRKKNQMTKVMPKVAEEDSKDNDDGIIVRTIKSRPLERDRERNFKKDNAKAEKMKENKSDNGADRLSRIEREKQRNKERQARRKEERERKERNRSDGDKETKVTAAAETKDKSKESGDTNETSDKQQVKKNNENRRLRRERQREKQQKPESANSKKGSRDSQTSSNSIENNNTLFAHNETSQSQKERSITNLRNKDRPSLQIYQPGKRRPSGSGDADNTRSGEKSPSSSELDTVNESPRNNKDNRDDARPNDNRRKRSDGRNDKSRGDDDGNKNVPTNEKRISRYSEKRNKAKEKRDTNVEDGPSGQAATTGDN